MNEPTRHIYHLRPGYASDKLLLQFNLRAEPKDFVGDLFVAINGINPKEIKREDLWMNDEWLYTYSSDKGELQLSVDAWGFAFILADNNQHCILAIDELLAIDSRFEKVEVEFSNYKL